MEKDLTSISTTPHPSKKYSILRTPFPWFYYPTVLLLGTFALGVVAIWPGIGVGVLWADDGNFLAGGRREVNISSAPLGLRDPVLSQFLALGVPTMRLLFIGIHSVAVAALYLFALPFVGRMLATIPAMMLAAFPFDSKMGLFVIGSDGPATAFWMIVIALSFVLFLRANEQASQLVFALWTGLLALFAVDNAGYSPLLGFLPLFWMVLAGGLKAVPWRPALTGMLATGPAFLYAGVQRLFSPNHYFGIGWTETSVSGVIGNIPRVAKIFVETNDLPYLLLAIVLSALLAATFERARAGNPPKVSGAAMKGVIPPAFPPLSHPSMVVLLLAAISLVASAVLPVLVVSVSYGGRYSWSIGVAVLILGLILVSMLRRFTFARRTIAILSIFFILIGTVQKIDTQRQEVARNAVAIQSIETFLKAESASWPLGSQIVLVTDGLACCGKYNHWSTGNINSLTGREDLTALIGEKKNLSGNPLVSEWNHGGWWRQLENGAMSRIRMKGLVIDAGPLFLYVLDGKNMSEALEVKFEGESCALSVPPGASIGSATADQKSLSRGAFIWKVDSCLAEDSSSR